MDATKRRPPLPRLLSARELSEQTGIPRSTWYDRIAAGEVPCVRLGRSVRVAEADAERYLAGLREVAG